MKQIQKKSLLNGITILGITGLICKMLGVFYRIPLAWLVHEEGLGLYQLVFPSYAMLLTVSSAGIPVAISKMISYSLAENDVRTAKKTFKTALCMLIVIGFISMLIMFVGAEFLSYRVGNPKTKMGFIAIAPSLLLVCVMSAYRGYMQGLSDMKPTAISQLIEQIGKVLISLPLAYYGMRHSVSSAAALALSGISVAEFLALVYMYVKYKQVKPQLDTLAQDNSLPQWSNKDIAKKLLKMAIPITLGATVVPLAGFVDSAMLVNRLASQGMDIDTACRLYGLYSGLVITLINVPTALAVALSMSLVPAISASSSEKNTEKIQKNTKMGLRFAFLIGLPCSVGMSILAKELLYTFYSSLGEESLHIAARLLEVSSFTILTFTVVQATSGILQGMQKERIPMYTLVLGVAIKIVLNYIFVGNPHIHIYGAPYASLVCYCISVLPNIYYVNKYSQTKFDYATNIIRPGLACIGMAVVIMAFKTVLPFHRLSTIFMVVMGMFSFLGFGLLSKAITKEDIQMFKRRGKKHA